MAAGNAACADASNNDLKRNFLAVAKSSPIVDSIESFSPNLPTKTGDISYRRGAPVRVNRVNVNDKRLIFTGRFLTIARLQDEWYDDVGNPESIVKALEHYEHKPDIFTFWQRLPDVFPVYPYYYEPEALSAIPLQTYDHWWNRQIRTDTRKKIKRPEKRGIEIRVVSLDDAFVSEVMKIFNETPVRRGRRFAHFGKSFEELKEMLSRDLRISEFAGAYHEDSLVGFVKLNYAEGRFANPGLIVSKLEFRRKYVNNALVAKAVEMCTRKSIPYLTYTNWRRGSQADFLMRHGFEKICVPRYWIPFTKKGHLAIKTGFHRSLRNRVPEPIRGFFLDLRKSFYDRRYNAQGRNAGSGLD
jgi:hypothetical protein